MRIPLIVIGKEITKNAILEEVNIKDIAPTITKLLGVEPDEEWEGKCVL